MMNARSMLRVIQNMIQGTQGTNHVMHSPVEITHERLPRVLVVEDEPSISGFVRRGLIFEGFEVDVVADGHEALASLRKEQPDVLVLDLMLPGVDGIDITRRIRSAETADNAARLPILMLTARDSVADRVAGLDAGADDYLVKPFDFDELVARVRALLRRARPALPEAQNEVLEFEDIRLDLTSHILTRGGDPIEATPREFDLLELFMRHPNQVLTRSTLMQRVWGEDFYGESNVLEVVIGNLRRSLEAGGRPRVIQTVRGIGYVLRLQT
jgi:two-component system response regulator MprA